MMRRGPMGFLRGSSVKCFLAEDRAESLSCCCHFMALWPWTNWPGVFSSFHSILIYWRPFIFNMCSLCISPHIWFALDPWVLSLGWSQLCFQISTAQTAWRVIKAWHRTWGREDLCIAGLQRRWLSGPVTWFWPYIYYVQENHLVTSKGTVVMEGLLEKQEKSQSDVSRTVINCCPTIWFGVWIKIPIDYPYLLIAPVRDFWNTPITKQIKG